MLMHAFLLFSSTPRRAKGGDRTGSITQAFSLLKPCSNTAAEYQALIIGLELALESCITMLEAFGDSQLIINQMNQEYEIRKPDLSPYYNKAQSLRQMFDICHITHIRKGENIRADALAGLAASFGSGWTSRIGFKNFSPTRSSEHLSKRQQNPIHDACPQSQPS